MIQIKATRSILATVKLCAVKICLQMLRSSFFAQERKGTNMSSLVNPIPMPAQFARSVAVAALMGATMLASPLTAARADTAIHAPIRLVDAAAPQNRAAAGATDTNEHATKEPAETKMETVEQRISDLHTALKITPDQDSLWNAVAQAMRENAANIDKLVAENKKTSPQDMTAVEDLEMYQKYAQAHVDGLKNLIVSFDTLYKAMPDAQKKNADEVFRTSGRRHASSEK